MEKNKINHISIIVAALPYVLLGYPWFRIFRDPWFEGGGLTVKQLINGPGYLSAFTIAIISSIIMAYTIAFFLNQTNEKTVSRGLKTGLIIWAGFILPLLATQYTFEARSFAYFGITCGYPLISLLIMGSVIGGWKQKSKNKGEN